jgi:hypothetical protein
MAPLASAQQIDVTASLDVTDGLARVGYYVPVTLKATNKTDRAATEVFVETGGPVDVRASWVLSAGETDETVLPVFYVGGDLTLEVVFRDKTGGELTRLRLEPLEVRPVTEETVLVWHTPMAGEPDDTELDMIRRQWEDRPLRILCKSHDSIYAANQCQLVDTLPFDLVAFSRCPRVVVTPQAYALMGAEDLAAVDPVRVWVWLALFAVGVLAVVLLVPRRRATWAAAGAGMLGVAVAAAIWVPAGGSSALLREARLVSQTRLTTERFVLLQARGEAMARFRFGDSRERTFPSLCPSVWPRPVFRSADDMFRPAGVLALEKSLVLAEDPVASFAVMQEVRHVFESTRPVCLIHMPVCDVSGPWPEQAPDGAVDLAGLARRPDVVAALLVRGSEATDAAGKAQPLDAWAVAWKTSGEADLAWCGRSLAWWDEHRRTGDGPFLVAWFRDPAPDPPEGIDVYERLPAMVVTSE